MDVSGLDTWEEGSDDSKLHAEAKELLAQGLRCAGYTAYIEYPLPFSHSQRPKSFLWSRYDRARGEDEYYSFNGSSIPTPKAAIEETGPLSFIFDVAVENYQGILGVFEIYVTHPVHEAKKRFLYAMGVPMQEIDARWLMANYRNTDNLLTVDGRTLTPSDYFRMPGRRW